MFPNSVAAGFDGASTLFPGLVPGTDGPNRRHLDRALWAFGNCLTTGYGRAVIPAKNRNTYK
jgi:hypothetical protein